MKDLYKRLLDICYERQLHHLGSYFSALQIIDQIYSEMDKDDIFILSNGHAVVALYVILEKYYGLDAVELHEKYGDHPKRNELDKLHFLNTSKKLNHMNSNLDSYSEEQITKALNEQLQEYIPLFELLLDTEEYEDVAKYEKYQNTIVQSFVPIVEKLNEIERIEKEKMEENEQLI